MIKTRRQVLKFAAAGTAVALARPAIVHAQGDYPNKPIRIIIPSAPGGPSDFPARIASQFLPAKLGQPIVIENRAGAGGAIGARAAAAAPPDGYTLMVGNTSTLAAIPAVSTSAGYDPVKDFAPIVKITEGYQILVVHPSSPWKTLKEFIDHAKANPGKLNYATTGPGGLPHLAGELFILRSGTKLTPVSYRSGGESLNAVLSQTVNLTFENVAILLTQIRAGKVRALAVQNRTRAALAPEIPTMAEAGVPDCEANTFFGLVAPAKTPEPILKKLNAAMNEGLASADIQKVITNLGTEAKPNSPQDFADYIATQHKKWVAVAKAANIKIS
jgi:tripartite-type tricarboxylate transporter receptor subunit TctC